MPSFKIVRGPRGMTIADNTDYDAKPSVSLSPLQKDPPPPQHPMGQPSVQQPDVPTAPPPVEELAPAIEALQCEHCSFMASSRPGLMSHVRAKHK